VFTNENQQKYQVYIVTSPYELQDSGDSDYAVGLSGILGECGEYLKSEKRESDNYALLRQYLRHIENYNRNGSFNICPKFQGSIDTQLLYDLKNSIVESFSQKIIDEKKEGYTSILNLHMRPPETGTIFSPDDLKALRAKGIKIVITCHEYCLNDVLKNNIGRNRLVQLYFKEADRLVFFNKSDRDKALADVEIYTGKKRASAVSSLIEKASLVAVGTPMSLDNPPILSESTEEILARPSNILFFGLIRPGKGFELVPQMVRELKKRNLPKTKIILAGGVADMKFTLCLVNALRKIADKEKLEESEFLGKNKEEVAAFLASKVNVEELNLPIEIHFNVKSGQLLNIIRTCRYAVMYDGVKGFAYNSSALITALANSCIIFVNKGICTPEDVVEKKSLLFFASEKKGTYVEALKQMSDEILLQLTEIDGDVAKSTKILECQKEFFRDKFSSDQLSKSYGELFASVAKEPVFALSTTNVSRLLPGERAMSVFLERFKKNSRPREEEKENVSPNKSARTETSEGRTRISRSRSPSFNSL
jgi:glycosyltransferase involved in cell wall biosynthesis